MKENRGSKSVKKGVTEQGRELPLTGEWDLIVAGAGLSGVAAAVAAAREGLDVCIVDKQYGPGGLATLGNVTMWLPLCDGRGRQVTAGLAEELLQLSVADLTGGGDLSSEERETLKAGGLIPPPSCWLPGGDRQERKKHRYQADFNPASYLYALEKLLTDEGVKILYDTRICGVIKSDDGRMVDYLAVENKSGRSALSARFFIDGTGDADLAFLSGEPTHSADGNVPAAWSYSWGKQGVKRRLLTRPYSPRALQEGYDGPFFRGDDVQEVTAQVLASRQMVREKMEEFRRKEGDPRMQLLMPPVIPCFRMTRRLVGRFVLKDEHRHTWLEDSVGFVGDWRKAGPVYPVPFSSLCPKRIDNLLVVGRSISVDNSAWDALRVFPPCAVTGEAAGTAAALSSRSGQRDVVNISPPVLQQRLLEKGALLDKELLAEA